MVAPHSDRKSLCQPIMALRVVNELVERAAEEREAAIMGIKGPAKFESNNMITKLICSKEYLIFGKKQARYLDGSSKVRQQGNSWFGLPG